MYVCLFLETGDYLSNNRIGGSFEMTATALQKFDGHEISRHVRKPQRGPESF